MLAIEPLEGGITNRNFRLRSAKRDVVLRLHGKDTGLLGIDRRHEYEAANQAGSLGLAPLVAGLVEPELYLVTEFMPGAAADLHHPTTFSTAVTMMRRWHESPAISGTFDAFGLAETYALRASLLDPAALPQEVEGAIELSTVIGQVFTEINEPPSPCHNDLLGANFLSSTTEPGRLWLLDWEYAGMNSRWFDLGNFSINNGLDAAGNDRLIELYFGAVTPMLRARLTLMRVMSDVREAMWGVLQQRLSTIHFDYADYARQHFYRMIMNASTQQFRDALQTAAG